MVGVFGVPDMGGVCSEKHVPNYLQNVSRLAMFHFVIPMVRYLCPWNCPGIEIGNTTLQVDKLEEAGVKKVVCLAVAEPEEVSEWADKVGLTGSKIEVWADTKGAWTRMLGLDVNQYNEPGPRSQR